MSFSGDGSGSAGAQKHAKPAQVFKRTVIGKCFNMHTKEMQLLSFSSALRRL
jgi:hypothetical protein